MKERNEELTEAKAKLKNLEKERFLSKKKLEE